MKVLIVDDEPLARRRLRAQLNDLGIAKVVGEAHNGLAAIEAAEAHEPDVVLLDVRMPSMDGLEAARHLSRLNAPPAVIFTTAFDQHALAAFEAQAIDYLLKPIRTERLQKALERAAQVSAGRAVLSYEPQTATGRRTHVSAMVAGSLRLVALADVIYFQADQGYVNAVAAETNLLIEDSLKALEQEFANRFVRVHRNALVGMEHVVGLEKALDGDVQVVLNHSDIRLVVSRRLLGQVRKRLKGVS